MDGVGEAEKAPDERFILASLAPARGEILRDLLKSVAEDIERHLCRQKLTIPRVRADVNLSQEISTNAARRQRQ